MGRGRGRAGPRSQVALGEGGRVWAGQAGLGETSWQGRRRKGALGGPVSWWSPVRRAGYAARACQ